MGRKVVVVVVVAAEAAKATAVAAGGCSSSYVAIGVLLGLLRAVAGDAALAPAMFIFGDSLLDNGNNNFIPTIARANYEPYGIDFGYPSGRFCNGLTIVDFGAQLLGLPLIPPCLSPTSKGENILRGLNYASAAAGILDETGKHYGVRISFNGQIGLFEKTVKLELPYLLENSHLMSEYLAKSVFIINFGSNDYINNYLLPNLYKSSHIYSTDSFADLLISTFTQQLKKLYDLGARKMALIGIGALGCIPSQLSMTNNDGGCIDHVNDLVSAYNQRLIKVVATLNGTLSGSFFVYQDVYGSFLDIVNKPAKYGFKVANNACCGNGRYGGSFSCLPLEVPCLNRDQYIFWDSFHPTEAVNAILAQGSYTLSAKYCHPFSIAHLAQL